MFDVEKNKTDVAGFEDGKWFEFQPGVEVKIAATQSKRSGAAFARIGKGKSLQDLQDTEVMEKIVRQVYAEAIIIDWKGFTKNGKKLPCTKENVLYALDSSLEFYQFVTRITNDIKNFRVSKAEGERKNSKAS